ncbi:phosphoethanolamine methyltransferase [Thermosulfuriphilus ammonigenes]|uniref:Phosphoethanolamine methyltransferase n=1 Tax=Thermosulfuriphilus ammonigenes TaxID=1936021 RepID=A0A6G7PWK1_9BACT|nr:DHH family phosphoesterase [Thermosulfuriphilus ammonigenes]MBA2847731.1 nanoRNase/pAp phosphatase (c-di-AMP/oligoRNAs hydrolase) [Thermosulfuriphilus ammonigenes]QIJ72064.1 phosphoethanolamine methyltransferase [Thermosulfuriphilus ammonigenes]HFB83666.1 phosphoethanolamine methyltransferase [Thermodesulfatator sp.]
MANGKNNGGAKNGNRGRSNASKACLEPKVCRWKSNKERLRGFLSLFKKEDNVLVTIWADPDSLASALAIKRLLTYRVSSVTIAHPNEIKRVNNQAMVQLLKIPLVKLRSLKVADFSKKILVDSQPPHFPEFSAIEYDAVIDHHPLTTGWQAPFVDIRPEYGAVSSMMTEYLKAAGIKPSVALATALFYGIKVDTRNFEKQATVHDVLSFQYLFKRINRHLVHKIEASDIRRSELKYFRTAFDVMKIYKSRIFAHLGKVHNPDILVVVADFFNHVHDIGWVFVSGEYKEKLVVIIRCDGYRKNAGSLAKRAFGQLGTAGGHRESARAEIPLENLEGLVRTLSTRTLQRLVSKHFRS